MFSWKCARFASGGVGIRFPRMMCAAVWHVPHEVTAADVGLDDIFQEIQIRPIVLIVAAGVGNARLNERPPFRRSGRLIDGITWHLARRGPHFKAQHRFVTNFSML